MTSIDDTIFEIQGWHSSIRKCLLMTQQRALYATYPFDDDDALGGEIIPHGPLSDSVFDDAVSVAVDHTGNVEL